MPAYGGPEILKQQICIQRQAEGVCETGARLENI